MKNDIKKIALALLMLTVFVSGNLAFAADTGVTGFDIQRFRPTIDRTGTFNVYGSRILTNKLPSFGLDFNFAQSLFEITSATGGNTQLVNRFLTIDATAAIGFADRVTVGFDVPVHARIWEMYTTNATNITTSGLGDVRLAAKGLVLADKGNIPGVAIFAFGDLPTGSNAKFAGNKSFAGGGTIIVDKAFPNLRDFYITGNVGVEYAPSLELAQRKFGSMATFGLGAMMPIAKGFEILAEGNGSLVLRDMDRRTTPITIMGGANYRLPLGLSARIGGGASILNAVAGPKYTITAGVGYDMGKSFEADKERRKLALVEVKHQKEKAAFAQRMASMQNVKPIQFSSFDLAEINAAIALPKSQIFELADTCPPPDQFNAEVDDPACQKIFKLREAAISCPPPDKFIAGVDPLECQKIFELGLVEVSPTEPFKVFVLGEPVYNEYMLVESASEAAIFELKIPDADKQRLIAAKKKLDAGVPAAKIKELRSFAIFQGTKYSEVNGTMVWFNENSKTLRRDQEVTLQRIAKDISKYKDIEIVAVTGFADPEAERAEGLAVARAEAVKKYLEMRGISAKRLEIYDGNVSPEDFIRFGKYPSIERCVIVNVKKVVSK